MHNVNFCLAILNLGSLGIFVTQIRPNLGQPREVGSRPLLRPWLRRPLFVGHILGRHGEVGPVPLVLTLSPLPANVRAAHAVLVGRTDCAPAARVARVPYLVRRHGLAPPYADDVARIAAAVAHHAGLGVLGHGEAGVDPGVAAKPAIETPGKAVALNLGGGDFAVGVLVAFLVGLLQWIG